MDLFLLLINYYTIVKIKFCRKCINIEISQISNEK